YSYSNVNGTGQLVFQGTFNISSDTVKNQWWNVGFRFDSYQSGKVHWKEFMVVKGTQAIDWSPAPEDKAQQSDFTSLQQTLTGFQTTVNNSISGLQSQQTQTAAQVSTNLTDLTNRIS